jgi:hypothetical protein
MPIRHGGSFWKNGAGHGDASVGGVVEKYRADWLDRGLDPKAERKKLKAEERKRDEETAAKEAGNAVTFKGAAEAYAKVPAHAKQWTNDPIVISGCVNSNYTSSRGSGTSQLPTSTKPDCSNASSRSGVLKPFGICAVASRKYSTGARTRAGVLRARTRHRGPR